MNFRSRIVALVVVFVAATIGFVSMSVSYAASNDGSQQIACEALGSASSDSGGCSGSSEETELNNVINFVIQMLSAIAGIIGVIMMIVGGLKYITGGGDANAYASAKKTILYAIVGLLIAATAQVIVRFVLTKANGSGGTSSQVRQRELDVDAAVNEMADLKEQLESAEGDDKKKAQKKYNDAQKKYWVSLSDLEKAQKKENKSKAGNSSTSSSAGGSGDACYAVPIGHGKNVEGKMFHRSGSQTYAFENSPAGIAFAARNGYNSIDLDTHITKDGVVVVTHWYKPMLRESFYDPQGKLPRSTPVSDMTYEQIRRLRHRDGRSQIYSVKYMIEQLNKYNLSLSLEVKSPYTLPRHLPGIAAQLNSNNVKTIIKGDAGLGGMNNALEAARKAGFWTRGTKGSQGWRGPIGSCAK